MWPGYLSPVKALPLWSLCAPPGSESSLTPGRKPPLSRSSGSGVIVKPHFSISRMATPIPMALPSCALRTLWDLLSKNRANASVTLFAESPVSIGSGDDYRVGAPALSGPLTSLWAPVSCYHTRPHGLTTSYLKTMQPGPALTADILSPLSPVHSCGLRVQLPPRS